MWETLDIIMATRESTIMGLLEHVCVCGPCFQLVYNEIPIELVFFFCLWASICFLVC